jgi:hypothetical protein
MSQIDATDPAISRVDEMFVRVDAYRAAKALLGETPHNPSDVLELADFIAAINVPGWIVIEGDES